ncbi:MAG: PIN domain-containing protein [Caulobacteraceae bacterium]|nr:PIN domain-containing protein [Caulobacter sp.]
MILVDSNVILDVLGGDPRWSDWSLEQLDTARSQGELTINPVVYAEVAPRFDEVAELDGFLAAAAIEVLPLDRAQLFAAGHAHRAYRRRGGERGRVLPDFLIGAQALLIRAALLTRDARVYRTYFPDVRLITP